MVYETNVMVVTSSLLFLEEFFLSAHRHQLFEMSFTLMFLSESFPIEVLIFPWLNGPFHCISFACIITKPNSFTKWVARIKSSKFHTYAFGLLVNAGLDIAEYLWRMSRPLHYNTSSKATPLSFDYYLNSKFKSRKENTEPLFIISWTLR